MPSDTANVPGLGMFGLLLMNIAFIKVSSTDFHTNFYVDMQKTPRA